MAQAKQKRQRTPLWEKVIAIIGMLFLLGIVGFLLYEALQPTTLPVVTVAIGQIHAVEGGYLVEIEATNLGKASIAGVEIEGTISDPDGQQAEPVETSAITFDYIPSQSARAGGLFFREDPNQYLLEVQAKGYIDP